MLVDEVVLGGADEPGDTAGCEGVMVVKMDVMMVVTERLGPRLTIVVGIDEIMSDTVVGGAALLAAEPDAGVPPDEAGEGAADEGDG